MNPCVIFDIDGVLADSEARAQKYIVEPMKEGRPKQWAWFFQEMAHDTPIQPLMTLMHTLHDAGSDVLIFTGRPSSHRAITLEWLRRWSRLKFCGPCPQGSLPRAVPIWMREAADRTDDHHLKTAWVEDARELGYDPTIAIDDRPRIARAYRKMGLIALQVQEREF